MSKQEREDDKFHDWRWRVERAIRKLTGAGSGWLPDYDYWADFNSGSKPDATARKVVEHAATF